MSIYTIQSRLCNTFQLIFETVLFVILHDCPVQQHCSWWHLAFVGLTIKTRCLKLSLYILFDKKIIFNGSHCVYLSCLHLETTAQVISQDASILSSVVMSIKVMYTHIYVSHTRTQTQYTLTHWYSPRATILLHQKLLWHIEVIRTDIMFCKLLLYSQTPKLHFSKLQKSWKRSKVLNNTDYIVCCFFVNMMVRYAWLLISQHANIFTERDVHYFYLISYLK